MEKETTFKEKLKTLSVKLGIIDDENVVTSKFEEVVLSDETKVMIEPAIEVGADVMIDVDGEMQAVPDNTYEISDGRKFVVVGGKIESIEEVATDEAEEEMSSEDTLTLDDVKKMIEAIGFSSVKDEVKAIKAEFEAYKSLAEKKSKENNKAVIEAFKALGEQPEVEPKKKRSGLNVSKRNTFAEALINNNKK